MSKAIAIAAVSEESFKPAFASAKNFMWFLADFMYGTPARVKMTYMFAFALMMLGFMMDAQNAHALASCPI
jgi:hypothetical protein